MGGEKYSVLMYGPKQKLTTKEWIEKLQVIDKKKWVKNFLEIKVHDYEGEYDTDDEEGIDIVFEQEIDSEGEGNDLIIKFLEQNGLSFAFDNNCCWEEFSIGLKVEDYDGIKDEEKSLVVKFCEKYELNKPTFYAGIIGEYE